LWRLARRLFNWFTHEGPRTIVPAPRSKTLVDNASPDYVSYEQSGEPVLKLRTRAAAYGLAGLVLAGVVIFSGSELGLLSTSSSGVLSLLLTDPPSVPNGVTAVFVTYSGIQVHATGLNDSGWVSFPGQGTIDTLKLVNLSQTISSGSLPSLTYNMVQFEITKVTVTYMGANYSAAVASGKLVVPIVGGVKVSSSNPAAALVDIQPTILNLGNQTGPSFTMATGARALQVPSDEVSDSMREVGNSYSLQGHSWYQDFSHHQTDNLTASGLTLSASSFSFSAANTGSDALTLRMVILIQAGQNQNGDSGMGMFSNSMANSVIFIVQSDGSLKLVSGTPDAVGTLLQGVGYTIAGGASHSFTFTGTITSLLGKHMITSGSKYNVALMGSDVLGTQTVVAS
jgi:uncharacterized protein DUF4382